MKTSRSVLGAAFRYKLDVHSKNGGLKYSLNSHPEGMTVDDAGTIAWKAVAQQTPADVNVRMTIRDAAGRSVSYAFTFRVFAEDAANLGG